jgi:hypothetical protein
VSKIAVGQESGSAWQAFLGWFMRHLGKGLRIAGEGHVAYVQCLAHVCMVGAGAVYAAGCMCSNGSRRQPAKRVVVTGWPLGLS